MLFIGFQKIDTYPLGYWYLDMCTYQSQKIIIRQLLHCIFLFCHHNVKTQYKKKKLLGSIFQKLCPILGCYVYDNVFEGWGVVGVKFTTLVFIFLLIPSLSMKQGSLFCFVVMRSTEPGCFRSCSCCLWKALDEEGCMGLVPWWCFGLVVQQKFLNIKWFLSWKLNWIVVENFGGIGMCLLCRWKDLDEQDLIKFSW